MSQFEEGGKALKSSEATDVLELLTNLEKQTTETNMLAFKLRDILFGASPSTAQEKNDPHTGGGLITRIRVLVNAISETTIETNNELTALLNKCNH